jgi:hypothetical protein
LGRKIERSQNKPLAQLYAGHRGTGKSTELLRLKKYLEERKCHVVYFAADEGDIDPEDADIDPPVILPTALIVHCVCRVCLVIYPHILII